MDSAIKKKMEDIISGADPGFLGISDVFLSVFRDFNGFQMFYCLFFRIFRDFRCFTVCFPGISDVLPFVFWDFRCFPVCFQGFQWISDVLLLSLVTVVVFFEGE